MIYKGFVFEKTFQFCFSNKLDCFDCVEIIHYNEEKAKETFCEVFNNDVNEWNIEKKFEAKTEKYFEMWHKPQILPLNDNYIYK